MEEQLQGITEHLQTAKTAVDLGKNTGLPKRAMRLLPRKSDNQIDYSNELLKGLRENALETVRNTELTIEQAVQILGPTFDVEDLDKLSPTWEKHWMDHVSRVSIHDNERRVWWGRLLAGEIQKPGSYSLRTLSVMDRLSTEEALLFTRICGYVWYSGYSVLILPKKESAIWRPNTHEGTVLNDSGLVTHSTADYTVNPTAVSNLELRIGTRRFIVSDPKDNAFLRLGQLYLTNAGREMYTLTTPEVLEAYMDEIVKEWQLSFSVEEIS